MESVLAPQASEETFGGVAAGAVSVTVNVLELPLVLAVTTAVVVELTAELAVPVKLAVVDPDKTVTDDGTDSAELLSEIATACPPPGAAPLKVTVQVAEPGGVHDEGVQVKLLTVTGGKG